MTSKEIIKRIIAHDAPPRFGYEFSDGTSDFTFESCRRQINVPANPFKSWGTYPELQEISGFKGETYRDFYGNIYGRFNGKTKGECVYGTIQDWDDYTYPSPEYDLNFREEILKRELHKSDKFVVTTGRALFSSFRDARLLINALMDTALYPDEVSEFVNKIADEEVAVIKSIAGCGFDGWMFWDDMGMQDTTFISPNSFREIFKPAYKKIADAVHEVGMAMIMHSCGYNYGLLEDLIDAGVDVFQFDQPDAYPCEVLAKEFANRVTFYSPVDVQKVLPTGDKEFIERRAKEMCDMFREAGGGWIAKDYPTYEDIGVETEWAMWAQKVIMDNSKIN